MTERLAAAIEQIAADRVHGASYLTARAAEVLLSCAGRSSAALQAVAVALVRAQPAMAPIFSLANRILSAADDEARREVCRDAVEGASGRVNSSAECAAELIQPGTTVMTHSHSTAVERAFVTAWERGTKFQVMAPESRPLREGVTLACVLAGHGIPVRVIADAGAGRYMTDAACVLVGADAVTPRGITNKLGTLPVALAAREAHKPVYAVCASDKFVGEGAPVLRDALHAPEEIVPERPAGVGVSNHYFDTTPLELFAGVVTEAGILDHTAVQELLHGIRIHPVLAGVRDMEVRPGSFKF